MPDNERDDLVQRSFGLHVRAVRAELREADFVCSTDTVDSYDEVVEQKWDLRRYLSNPVVLFAHDSRCLPIGKASKVGVVNGELVATITFATEKANPLAEQVWQSVQEQTLRAVSVGFMSHSCRWEKENDVERLILSDNELYEISVTPIPANPDALAKMRARARQAATKTTPPARGPEESTMNEDAIKALEARASEKSAQVESLTKDLDLAKAKAAVIESDHAKLSERHAALTAEHDALAKKHAEVSEKLETVSKSFVEARAKALDLEVGALVGVKILPAEKDEFLELAKSNRSLFERMVAKRSDLKVLERALPEGGPADLPDSTHVGDDIVNEAMRLAGASALAPSPRTKP
jgi:HK97 family phage prohead protease